jgi:hypothetical protein
MFLCHNNCNCPVFVVTQSAAADPSQSAWTSQENASSPAADANGARSLEATMGIEPMCTDLQSVA